MKPVLHRVQRALRIMPLAMAVGVTAGHPGMAAPAPATEIVRPPLPPGPRPPLPKTAVEQFRELLAASPEKREEYLSKKKPASAELIRASLREFDQLTPNERELRLRVLQLHQNLAPLLQAGVTERGQLLAEVPAEDRPLLEDRLKAWDGLPESARQVLLTDKAALNHFIQLQRPQSPRQADAAPALPAIPDSSHAAVEAQFEKWQALPEDVRARTIAEFQRFFELTPTEREKTLRQLSEAERREMARTLKTFENLPPEQRDRCVRAFRKFAGMTASERAEFLRSASHWREMDPDERAAWRRLVNTLAAPRTAPPIPQIPPARSQLVATNAPGERAAP